MELRMEYVQGKVGKVVRSPTKKMRGVNDFRLYYLLCAPTRGTRATL